MAGARVTMPPLRLLRVSAVLLTFGLALPLLGWSLPSMAVLAFVAGLAIAPVVMSAYGLVDAVAARGTAAEAFSWITTAVFAGFSVGMALGGTLIDAYGAKASFVLGTAAAALGAVLVAVGPGLGTPTKPYRRISAATRGSQPWCTSSTASCRSASSAAAIFSASGSG